MDTPSIPGPTASHRASPLPCWAEPPGGILVWLIVFVELLTFGMGLLVFLAQSREHAEIFQKGRASLNQSIGLVNTLVLLTGGWFMTHVPGRLRHGRTDIARRWLLAAAGTGGLFLLLKCVEYQAKLEHGLDLHADIFFTLYWLLTAFHFIHVLVATVILLVLWRGLRTGHCTAAQHGNVESGAVFWHMCDLIWLMVYPVIYLLR
jgi:nitric oxide reductase NorE protein